MKTITIGLDNNQELLAICFLSHVGQICGRLTRREEAWHDVYTIPAVYLLICLYSWHCFSHNVVASLSDSCVILVLWLSSQVRLSLCCCYSYLCLDAFYVPRILTVYVCVQGFHMTFLRLLKPVFNAVICNEQVANNMSHICICIRCYNDESEVWMNVKFY